MITKEALDQYEAFASVCKQATIPGEEFRELVRLAKLGLMVEEWIKNVPSLEEVL